MFVYPSARPSGAAVLMFPGGGYQHVAIGKGSGDIARMLNAVGVCVFMLKYRLPLGRWAAGPDVVLQDGQRAMRLIRVHAGRLSIDRVAVLGFSAGGFGAATLATRYSAPAYDAIDVADRQSARPDIAGLFFPVIALDRSFAHAVSRDNLLGANAPADLAARYSPDLHIPADMPPTFLAHAEDDPVVSAENSVAMYKALVAAKIATELHIFPQGGHGLHVPGPPNRAWMDLFLPWANRNGFTTWPKGLP